MSERLSAAEIVACVDRLREETDVMLQRIETARDPNEGDASWDASASVWAESAAHEAHRLLRLAEGSE